MHSKRLLTLAASVRAIFTSTCISPQHDLRRLRPFLSLLVPDRDWIESINGKENATAGIGVATGNLDLNYDQWSIPVDDFIDSAHPKRTNQRTELLTAIEGVERLRSAESQTEKPRRKHSKHKNTRPEWVITTDSEYVVKGFTEWFPAWEVRRVVLPPHEKNAWKGAGYGANT